ncbi:hypothetical protein AX15_002216 [Amanita polypyramis BW_CC]|nr:hypothetical protein AX15_002216 [Amanita polypyramis BW_CC]
MGPGGADPGRGLSKNRQCYVIDSESLVQATRENANFFRPNHLRDVQLLLFAVHISATMAFFRASRIFLYALIWIFSVILIGFTSSRIHFTHASAGFYEPITAEILSTSIIALLWTSFMMLFLALRIGGVVASYFVENVMNFIIWVLYLVGTAIFSHKFAHIGKCRRGAETCRIITGAMAFSWINWALFTFLIMISLAHMAWAEAAVTAPGYSEKVERGAETREREAVATA